MVLKRPLVLSIGDGVCWLLLGKNGLCGDVCRERMGELVADLTCSFFWPRRLLNENRVFSSPCWSCFFLRKGVRNQIINQKHFNLIGLYLMYKVWMESQRWEGECVIVWCQCMLQRVVYSIVMSVLHIPILQRFRIIETPSKMGRTTTCTLGSDNTCWLNLWAFFAVLRMFLDASDDVSL